MSIARVDAAIDRFVETVNDARIEPGDTDEIPPSVAAGGVDEFGLLPWKIQPIVDTPWIAEVQSGLPSPLPPSYRSLIARYAFPAFEIDRVFLFANTPEGTTPFELRAKLRDPIAREIMAVRNLVQFGNPRMYDYDPVCFDMSARNRDGEFPIVRVDHEDVLCNRRRWATTKLAASFLELIA